MTPEGLYRGRPQTDWNGVLGDLFGTDQSNKADSIHDSSSGFASDVNSYQSTPSPMSTFKPSRKPPIDDRRNPKDRRRGIKPENSHSQDYGYSSNRSSDASFPNHYHPQDLNMQYRMTTPSPTYNKCGSSYRMSTPSPTSNRSGGSSANTPSSISHVSSGTSSYKSPHRPCYVSQMASTPTQKPPPVISYKNPAYEYQLDKHMEEIKHNIKRIELRDTDVMTSCQNVKYKLPQVSLFDLLTDDIIVKIFSNLPTDQLCRCSRVCSSWYRLVWDPILWKHIVINGEHVNVDKGIKYLTKRLSYNTPTVCVIVEKINLNGCERLTNKGLHTIAKRCPELRELKIQNCSNVTNEALFEVTSYCVNLEHLDVTGCPCITCISLTEQILIQASEHHLRQIFLRYLNMSDCYSLDDEGLQIISLHCSHLQYLYLRRCSRIGDSGLQFLVQYCLSLKELSISDCRKVTDFGISELGKLDKNLRYLSVAKCDKVSDVGIIHLVKHCQKLRYLNIRGCEAVSDDAIDVLARFCPRIRSLDLGKCDVTDEGLEVLARNCSQLKKLSLKSCAAITDEGVKAIAQNCKNLQQLNIQDCHLSVDAYRTLKRYCKKCFIEHTNPGFY